MESQKRYGRMVVGVERRHQKMGVIILKSFIHVDPIFVFQMSLLIQF